MDAIQQSLSQMMEVFHKRLDTIEGQLPTASPSSSEGLAAELSSFKSFVVSTFRALQTQIGMLAQQFDQCEMRARRKILLLHGAPESQKEETSNVIVKTIVERLKISGFSSSDISRCHRMGRAAGDKPRPVLVKFRDAALRDKVWRSKTSLKGSGLTLSEFLTKTRHDVFLEARQKFGVTKCWTQEGNIFVLGTDGARHRVNCSEDLAALQKKVGSGAKPQAATSRPAAIETKEATRPRRDKTGLRK